jgi:hypothetical protein
MPGAREQVSYEFTCLIGGTGRTSVESNDRKQSDISNHKNLGECI